MLDIKFFLIAALFLVIVSCVFVVVDLIRSSL